MLIKKITGATGKVLAKATKDVLEEYDCLDSVRALLFDNTAGNTGYDGGLMAEFQKLTGLKLHMIG